MTKSEKVPAGAVVEFKTPNRLPNQPDIGWIDEHDNRIPTGAKGMIIKATYKRLKDFRGWEYDIHIPSLGIVSPNWGKFAFDVICS
jgi:hypothetical protein